MTRCHIANQDRPSYNRALEILKSRNGDYSYDEEFRQRAACAGEDLNLFYPESGPEGFKAKKICANCPVWIDCLLMSLSTDATTSIGIFGRMGPSTREYLKRELGVTSREGFLWWQDYWAGNPSAPGSGMGGTRKVNITHCPNGHEYNEENTRIAHKNGEPYRQCWTCRREQRKKYKDKKGYLPTWERAS